MIVTLISTAILSIGSTYDSVEQTTLGLFTVQQTVQQGQHKCNDDDNSGCSNGFVRSSNRIKPKLNDDRDKQATSQSGEKSDATVLNITIKTIQLQPVQQEQHNCIHDISLGDSSSSNNISLPIRAADNRTNNKDDYQSNSTAANQNTSIPFILPFP